MATTLRSVRYYFPTLASVTNNTLTNFTQITIDLGSGTKTIKNASVRVTWDDIVTATGGSLTTKSVGLRLGAAAYTTVSNTNTLTHNGENLSTEIEQDFTTHFTTNWTGETMTCDVQIQINQSTGTTLGLVNATCFVDILYEQDDAEQYQVVTQYIPLNAPTNGLTNTATTYDTIPALDTEFPESTKTYRNIAIIINANLNTNASATDFTMTIAAGTANVTTGNYEMGLQSDRYVQYVWNVTSSYPSTASTQNFQLSTNVNTRMHHPQCYMAVTYRFDATNSTSLYISKILQLDVDSPIGGLTSSDFTRQERTFWIQESNITAKRIAFFVSYNSTASIAGLNMRIGTGAFVAYTDNTSVLAGTMCAMVRNDSAITLARGRNTINFDIYQTDTTDLGSNCAGFYIYSYTCDKPTQGIGKASKTVSQLLIPTGTAAKAIRTDSASVAIAIPETNYFLEGVGVEVRYQGSSTSLISGFSLQVERLSGEGGHTWLDAYADLMINDQEIGVFVAYGQLMDIFKRWPTDPESGRLDIETARRWRIYLTTTGGVAAGWGTVRLFVTYHGITYTASGTISGSSGGTVDIGLWRKTDNVLIGTTSRTGNGTYSLTFYDNTETFFSEARESGTLIGRSDDGTLSGSP